MQETKTIGVMIEWKLMIMIEEMIGVEVDMKMRNHPLHDIMNVVDMMATRDHDIIGIESLKQKLKGIIM